jgi:hypothetical protein
VTGGTALRRFSPTHSRRSPRSVTVETLTIRIAALVAERQQLRGGDAAPAALERNRLTIVRAQWELAQALIDRHLPSVPAQTAA